MGRRGSQPIRAGLILPSPAINPALVPLDPSFAYFDYFNFIEEEYVAGDSFTVAQINGSLRSMVLTAPRDHYRPSPLLPSAISLDNHDLDRGFALKDLFSPFTKEPNYEHWRVITEYSHDCLVRILERNRPLQYFKDAGLEEALASFFDANGKVLADRVGDLVEAYRSRVPLTTYADYKPYIQRMFHNQELGLLHAKPPDYWVKTSGTTSSSPKLFPFYTPSGYLDYWADFPSRQVVGTVHALSGFKSFSTRARGIDLIFKGSGEACAKDGAVVGSLSSLLQPSPNDIEPLAAKFIPVPVTRLRVALVFSLCEPNLEFFRCVYLLTLADFFATLERDWDLLLTAVERGSFPEPFGLAEGLRAQLSSLLEPRPSRASYLRSLIKVKPGEVPSSSLFEGIVPRIWPKLALIVGAFSSQYMVHRRTCQFYTTRSPFYIESGYSCSEAVVGYAIGLLPNHHVLNISHNYLEFLPIAKDRDRGVVLASELQVGREYEPILTTTQSCLMRYRLGDVVRMMGWYDHLPVVQLVRRRLDIMQIRGVSLYEEVIARALDATSLRRVSFCCFESQSRLGLYIELDPTQYALTDSGRHRAKVSQATLVKAAETAHRALKSTSAVYKSAFGSADPAASILFRLVTPGTFWRLMQAKPDPRISPTPHHSRLPLAVYDPAQLRILERAASELDCPQD
ncbi:hypothetical protein L0F63_000598 [Massospora cicadina]|nr:hypothetical protein L0F63_000598 [Massospora cicadina]